MLIEVGATGPHCSIPWRIYMHSMNLEDEVKAF